AGEADSMEQQGGAAPLTGVRVLTVGQMLPGIYCGGILRDLGADVTVIEPVRGKAGARDADRFRGIAGQFPNRSLSSGISHCEIDLKDPGGRECFLGMVGQADVVMEGFRPGAMARLGLDAEVVRGVNPRVIYVSI